MRLFPLVIRVDFPALTDYVAYLERRDNQQQEIDAMAEKVSDLLTKLQGYETKLKASETQSTS